MRIAIAAIGRLKAGAERELCAHYIARVRGGVRGSSVGPVQLIELPEGRGQSAELRKTDEAARLLAAVEPAELAVALDERGRALTSRQFAEFLKSKRDAGIGQVTFFIGGPDGHGPAVLERANQRVSLSALTLPHGLARIMLAEQLYRAVTILAGHPYHRD